MWMCGTKQQESCDNNASVYRLSIPAVQISHGTSVHQRAEPGFSESSAVVLAQANVKVRMAIALLRAQHRRELLQAHMRAPYLGG